MTFTAPVLDARAAEVMTSTGSAGTERWARPNARALASHNVRVVDLTPAALGPFVVPNAGSERYTAGQPG
jgi:acetaldehyde dehydrogenase (acetylating)